ncbi:hypothetical protein MHU86_13349 [Fragilaria crotonensis]|nr:hypothetical protein MHU86_13349 [Fragilaria crotonensis]
MSSVKPNATFNFPSFQHIVKSIGIGTNFENPTDEELTKGRHHTSDLSTEKSLPIRESPSTPAQKRSFADITMKITEVAEDLFLFGSGRYHERPVKRRRVDKETGDPQNRSAPPLPDFQLSVEAVWHQAQASSSLFDCEDD